MGGEYVVFYLDEPVNIEDPVLPIRINRRFRHDMTAQELYEATRGIWVPGRRREKASYAFAVFEGVVQRSTKSASGTRRAL